MSVRRSQISLCCQQTQRLFCFSQGDAGQEGAGQTGPEGARRDSGALICCLCGLKLSLCCIYLTGIAY